MGVKAEDATDHATLHQVSCNNCSVIRLGVRKILLVNEVYYHCIIYIPTM